MSESVQIAETVQPVQPVKLKCEVLAGRVYEAIKEAILDVKMAPGARLNMDQLARDLGVSISPIREALIRLAAERLVVSRPYAGYAVAELPSKQAFLDLTEARLVVESYAARVGAPRRDPAILKTMNEALQEIGQWSLGRRYREYRGLIDSDSRLHRAIVASAGNPTIVQMFDDLHPHTQMSRLYIHMQREVDSAVVLSHHIPIVQAFEQGDAEAAVEAVRVHMQRTVDWMRTLESI